MIFPASPASKPTMKRLRQPTSSHSLRGRENLDPTTPVKRAKLEEPACVSELSSGAAPQIMTKWERSIQSQIKELRAKVETLEAENRRYRGQAESRLEQRLQVKFYPLVQRMGEVEESVNRVKDKVRSFVADTSDDETDEDPLAGLSQPVGSDW